MQSRNCKNPCNCHPAPASSAEERSRPKRCSEADASAEAELAGRCVACLKITAAAVGEAGRCAFVGDVGHESLQRQIVVRRVGQSQVELGEGILAIEDRVEGIPEEVA